MVTPCNRSSDRGTGLEAKFSGPSLMLFPLLSRASHPPLPGGLWLTCSFYPVLLSGATLVHWEAQVDGTSPRLCALWDCY